MVLLARKKRKQGLKQGAVRFKVMSSPAILKIELDRIPLKSSFRSRPFWEWASKPFGFGPHRGHEKQIQISDTDD
jgi:hypothetical protein